MRKRVKINEAELQKLIAENTKKVLKEVTNEYGSSLLSLLGTVEQYMRDFNYNEEADLIGNYLVGAMNEDDLYFDKQVLGIIELVEKDITHSRQTSGENVHWDDFDDFVELLSRARQEYLLHFGDDNPKYTLMNVGINKSPKRYVSESYIRKIVREAIEKVLREE